MKRPERARLEGEVLQFVPTMEPAGGTLLVAAPNLADPNFRRRVVLLCDHNRDGSFGLVINQPLPMRLGDVVERHKSELLLHQGGPVQEETLHFVHKRADLPLGSREISPGIFWGGDFEKVLRLVEKGVLGASDIRFFAGYAGWGKSQIAAEMRQVSWFVAPVRTEFLFYPLLPGGEDVLWKRALLSLGRKYELLFNYPLDPSLN